MTGTVHAPLSVLGDGRVWLNADAPAADELDGRVVLVDFWTYSCVNWLRTLPYLQAWHDRYGDRGLFIAGVHAPEFDFEHDLANVRRAVSDLGVRHPVVIDNDFTIWRAFANRYWPAIYLVGRDGRIAFHHFGEGAYEESERAIAASLELDEDPALPDATGLAAAADWDTLQSPETYLGDARGGRRSRRAEALNQWALTGDWRTADEAVVLDTAPGTIAYRFQARDVNLVLAGPGAPVPFTVSLDGAPPGEDHGLDVDPTGAGSLAGPRMYQLVRQRRAGPERTFEITFQDAGARAYVFTFG